MKKDRSDSAISEEEGEFQQNELVLAKCRGWPLWPAFISKKENSKDFEIVWIDEFNVSVRNDTTTIKKFTEENFKECKNFKKPFKDRKKLQRATQIASDIYRGIIDKDSYIEKRNREIKLEKAKKRAFNQSKSKNANFNANNCRKDSGLSSLEKNKLSCSVEKTPKNEPNIVNNGFTQNENIFE